jgi:hypothetical protein
MSSFSTMTAIDGLRRVVTECMANIARCSSIQSYVAVCREFILPEGHIQMVLGSALPRFTILLF